jgi:predicted nucleic acid-binding Zn ribbon protein
VRKSAPRPLSAALDGFTAAIAPATTLGRVQEVWDRTVGPAIADAARPTAEREGVLTVMCSAAVWSQELDLMAATIIARLNDTLGDQLVRELRCRTQ